MNAKNDHLEKSNNYFVVVGKIAEEFIYSHKGGNLEFYKSTIKVERLSGRTDTIEILVSDKLLRRTDVEFLIGDTVCIVGQMRSWNRDGLRIYALASSITLISSDDALEETKTINNFYIKGFVCKGPVYRRTASGREVTGFMVAINRANGSDYIPCICWGQNARRAAMFELGEEISGFGRLQSRKYRKKSPDGNVLYERTTWELSLSKLDKEGE